MVIGKDTEKIRKMETLSKALTPSRNFHNNFHNVFMRTFMYGMVGSLAMFITSWEKADRMKDRFLDRNRDFGDVYDFIVVGGGTAGSIVANRLSNEYKVLLISTGGDPHPFHSIPFMTNFMSNYKEVDWMHTTVPQKHAFYGSTNNQARISQGLALGGTSNLDYMIYQRGNPQDYENWAAITNDPSWGFDSVMKYFKKHEKYDGPWKNEKFHGESGEVRIAYPSYLGMGNRFCNGGKEMGYSHVDLNGAYSEGFDMISYPTERGLRRSGYKSFLQKVKGRWNLEVHRYSHVNRILTRGDKNEAYGVEYDRHGKSRVAFARKEIILSAGSIQTPKLLMLSGIGPKDQLEPLGIPMKVNLPSVGQNLQDHLGVHLGPFFTDSKSTMLIDRDLTSGAVLKFSMNQGPLTSTGYEASAMMSSDYSKINGNPHWPDIQLTLNGMAYHDTADEDFAHAHRIRRDVIKEYFKNSKGKDSFSIVVSASRPQSRGEVRLQDADPYKSALIDPRYLERIEDVGVMIDGIKKSMRLVENTVSFQQIGSRFTNESVPGCQGYKFRSDDYWSCFVRMMSLSMGDVVGTAAMGRVVDSSLNVYGTLRLRVIDASVMPNIVSSNVGAATMMIGEKGAAIIMDLWGKADKQKGLLTDSKKISEILRNTAGRLTGIDTSSMFLNSIKNTGSFKEIHPEDLKDALGIGNSQFGALTAPTNSILTNTLTHLLAAQQDKVNPLRIIGSMLRNSLSPTDASQLYNYNSVNFANLRPTTVAPVTIKQTLAPINPFFLNQPGTSPKASTVDLLFSNYQPNKIKSAFQTESNSNKDGLITYPLEEVFEVSSESGGDPYRSSESKDKPHPTPYRLEPKPFFFSPPSGNAKGIHVQKGSLNSMVGSIVRQTIPVLAPQNAEINLQLPDHHHLPILASTKALTPNRPLNESRKESLRDYMGTILNIYPSPNPPPRTSTVSINPLQTYEAFTKITTQPSIQQYQKPTNSATFAKLTSSSSILDPIKSISRPISSLMRLPFDGMLKRMKSFLLTTPKPLSSVPITTKLPATHANNLYSTLEGPIAYSKPIINYPPQTFPSYRYFTSTTPQTFKHSPESLTDSVQHILQDNSNLYQYSTSTSAINKALPFSTVGSFASANTDMRDELKSSQGESPYEIVKHYQVVYERPSEESPVINKPSNLPFNIQHALESSFKPQSGKHISNQEPNAEGVSTFFLGRNRNLDEEIDKLIGSQNLTSQSQIYVLLPQKHSSFTEDKNKSFQQNLKSSPIQPPTSLHDSIPVFKNELIVPSPRNSSTTSTSITTTTIRSVVADKSLLSAESASLINEVDHKKERLPFHLSPSPSSRTETGTSTKELPTIAKEETLKNTAGDADVLTSPLDSSWYHKQAANNQYGGYGSGMSFSFKIVNNSTKKV